jgi:hypothetical protein
LITASCYGENTEISRCSPRYSNCRGLRFKPKVELQVGKRGCPFVDGGNRWRGSVCIQGVCQIMRTGVPLAWKSRGEVSAKGLRSSFVCVHTKQYDRTTHESGWGSELAVKSWPDAFLGKLGQNMAVLSIMCRGVTGLKSGLGPVVISEPRYMYACTYLRPKMLLSLVNARSLSQSPTLPTLPKTAWPTLLSPHHASWDLARSRGEAYMYSTQQAPRRDASSRDLQCNAPKTKATMP